MPGDHVQNHLRSPNPMHLCSSELGEDLLSTLPFFDDSNRRGKGRLRMRFKLNHHLLWLFPSRSLARACGARLILVCCVENARSAFSTQHTIFCAAKPREYPAREGEDAENQTRSHKKRVGCNFFLQGAVVQLDRTGSSIAHKSPGSQVARYQTAI